jgi:putative transposase
MQSTTHHPPHVYIDNAWYAITACVYQHRRLLATDAHKSLVRDGLKQIVSEFGLSLAAWVILDNHCHILTKTRTDTDLARAIRLWHGRASFELNKLDNARGRQVWHNYWDTCIETEKDYWTRFNYIHNNPVKHGYVRQTGDWAFSSYAYYRRTKGDEWLASVWERYPVVDFTDPNDRE